MSLNVVKFPDHYAALDIPDALRVLADEIEQTNQKINAEADHA